MGKKVMYSQEARMKILAEDFDVMSATYLSAAQKAWKNMLPVKIIVER